MLDYVIRIFVALLFAFGGGALLQLFASDLTDLFISMSILREDMGFFRLTGAHFILILIGAVLGGILGYALSSVILERLKRFNFWVETHLNKMPLHDVIAGVIGLAMGLILADLLGYSFSRIPVAGNYIPVLFSVVFGYLGIHIMIKKRKDFSEFFAGLPKGLKGAVHSKGAKPDEAPKYKLLDTSVIIDGRIADIVETGFLEGVLLIPVFVLEELQRIADSADSLKRVRGRRGLDILQKIRSHSTKLTVEITNDDFEDIIEVDSKLVKLAQKVGGKIITNDYNLNKVAELRGVKVLNINELANAVKPVAIPGEAMDVMVVKEGKEIGQGVAYLDDGTMIVIENGKRFIGENICVEVTSALQTAAGRMIFARPR
ncbi:MAG: TRAM domain-containing protein [Selenomonadaceae bacterium]|nr:TRAM domain-containing protein [Selenomonadaceae bacterium]